MIEILTENLAAGELKTFMVQGEYLEILEAQYPLDVFMMDRSGGQISTMRQAEASFFSRPGKFEVFQVQSDNAQRVRLFVGSGDAGTRRTAGVVSVVDGAKARTIADAAFISAGNVGGGAGTYAYYSIWNPVDSGVNAIVEAVSVTVSAASTVYCGTITERVGAGVLGAPSKRAAAVPARSKSLYDFGTPGVAPGFNAIFLAPALQANAPYIYTLKEPVVCPPGTGFMVGNQTAATGANVVLEWFEETN